MQISSFLSSLKTFVTKLRDNILAPYERWRLSKYYQSIKEIPEYKWREIYATLSLLPLSKTGRLCKRAQTIYDKLSDEIIDTFGVSENLKKLLNNLIKIEEIHLQILKTGDKSKEVFIEILEIKNQDLQGKHEDISLLECLLHFEQEGIKRDEKTITVFDFYTCYEYLKQKQKVSNG